MWKHHDAWCGRPVFPSISTDTQVMYEALSPLQQYQYQQIRILATPSSTTGDKAAAISGLGTTADESVLPNLAAFLADTELADSAQAAMWAIFMRCTVGPRYGRPPSVHLHAVHGGLTVWLTFHALGKHHRRPIQPLGFGGPIRRLAATSLLPY